VASGVNVDGKKKVIKKQRRSKNEDRRKKCFFVSVSGVSNQVFSL
jgi:hypothetical protein